MSQSTFLDQTTLQNLGLKWVSVIPGETDLQGFLNLAGEPMKEIAAGEKSIYLYKGSSVTPDTITVEGGVVATIDQSPAEKLEFTVLRRMINDESYSTSYPSRYAPEATTFEFPGKGLAVVVDKNGDVIRITRHRYNNQLITATIARDSVPSQRPKIPETTLWTVFIVSATLFAIIVTFFVWNYLSRSKLEHRSK